MKAKRKSEQEENVRKKAEKKGGVKFSDQPDGDSKYAFERDDVDEEDDDLLGAEANVDEDQ